ncbi:DUF4194 domain-containing protein [Nocardioides sp. B-3]|uniref:DUF4194 domain-containing protein n=1 Tax=Nocardioides sp. B-3 TaxID=2895565 RepID=UPI00215337FB|nr:DUF4194 domain-containing protein [Nocardioides sp. B-3]UUZ58669.1 DUF4194 domain-containing protein [Nocardioides sp. B-3]
MSLDIDIEAPDGEDFDLDLDDASVSLWEGDEGGLEHGQRLAPVTLLKQRFISARTHPRDWRVLVEHERVLRSRLNDLFLDLQIDRAREVAWKRQAVSETGSRLPTLLYDAAWSREETLVLVHLRDRLRAGMAGGDARGLHRPRGHRRIRRELPAGARHRRGRRRKACSQCRDQHRQDRAVDQHRHR